MSKLEGLGWIEYELSKYMGYDYHLLSIEINGSIDMVIIYLTYSDQFLFRITENYNSYYILLFIWQIDYVRDGRNSQKITYIPNMGDLLPGYHKLFPNVPETFKDKYFSRKEMENLLDLKDILNNLQFFQLFIFVSFKIYYTTFVIFEN